MPVRLSTLLCAAFLLSSTSAAAGVRVVKGGPAKKAARAAVVTALEQVGDLSVCWRSTSSGPVTVELVISSAGTVVRAKHRGQDAVAQCVAGVLAVQKLVGYGKQYTMVVEIDTRGGGGMEAIKSELQPYRARLDTCYERVAANHPGLAGAVKIGFLIRPDGRVVDVEVKSSTLGNSGVERCLIATMKAARLSRRPNGKTVSFSMALDFTGGARDKAGPAVATGSLRPSKEGPVSAAVLSKVMNDHKAAFSACYDQQARRHPRLAGQVVLRFTIRGDGTVRNVKIRETTLKNSLVEGCIVQVGKKLRFPGEKGREKTRVIYPFEFSRR